MAQDGSNFHTHCNHIKPFHRKEHLNFPYFKRYHPTPSLFNNNKVSPHPDRLINPTSSYPSPNFTQSSCFGLDSSTIPDLISDTEFEIHYNPVYIPSFINTPTNITSHAHL